VDSAARARRLIQALDCFPLGSMAEKLMNVVMNDGSRLFGELSQTALWYELRDHIKELDGVVITDFITDHVTQAWIDFTYRGYRFSINDQFADYWFIVDVASCPDEVLSSILAHCKVLLRDGEWA